jgi:hypothetical protein
MDKWVKNIIGLSTAVVVLILGWRFFTGSEGTFSIWEGKVTVKSKPEALESQVNQPDKSDNIELPSQTKEKITTETSSTKKDVEQKILSCRLPAHGVEAYKNSQEWASDSGWQKGGPSRAVFCETQRVNRTNEFPDRVVTLLSANTSHKSEYNPFKQDYYRHLCTYKDEWNPIYKLKENKECTKNEN